MYVLDFIYFYDYRIYLVASKGKREWNKSIIFLDSLQKLYVYKGRN